MNTPQPLPANYLCLFEFDWSASTGLGYVCTLERGHEGPHLAHDTDGVTVLASSEG